MENIIGMPHEIEEELKELNKIVNDIHKRHTEAIKRETEVFVNRIISIRNIYTEPILMTPEMAARFMDLKE